MSLVKVWWDFKGLAEEIEQNPYIRIWLRPPFPIDAAGAIGQSVAMENNVIVILTEPAFYDDLNRLLSQTSPPVTIMHAETDEQLQALTAAHGPAMRLIAFCTDVIVPPDILNRVGHGAYNFHPGPPEYRGIYPSCFAIFEQAARFGATAHRMTEEIDGGEIVGTEYFDLPPEIDRFSLDSRTFEAVMRLFGRLAPLLANLGSALQPNGEVWAGTPRTKRDFAKLCEITPDMSENDFDRRYRAVGEGPNHALFFHFHGHRFRLDNQRDDETVYRGGQTADPGSDI